MASLEDEKRWRAALRRLGLANVRQRLQQSAGNDAANAESAGIVTEPPHPPRQFVDAWYRALQQRRQRLTDVRHYVLTILALAAVVAGIVYLTVG